MLEDLEIARNTMKAIAVLIQDAEDLLRLVQNNDYREFDKQSLHMQQALQEFVVNYEAGNPSPPSQCIADSLRRIIRYARARSSKALNKIEFEMLPLLKEFFQMYYFFSSIYPDRTRMQAYFEHEMAALAENKYIDEAVRTGKYKYDLSIAVLAYNKLDYTKLCVESILKHVPQDIRYELILINHGSIDGTKEYFESIAPTKQIDILVNGGGFGAYTRYIEGKYFMLVSNDVLVTENAIRNMLRCIESDDKIALVVPTTPNVSNLQTIPAQYNSLDEMYEFAKRNNEHPDPYRWEQRVRLCDPVSLCRTSMAYSYLGVHWSYYIHSDLPGGLGFIDDKISLFYRRNDYKMILAKDSYCHHFGSVSLASEIAQDDSFYDKGRQAFADAFGIDPWGPGFCWSPEMMAFLPCMEEGHVNVLGLNCGLGSNPLKIKETIKENAHNLDVTLYNATDDERYSDDLRGTSDIFQFEPDSAQFDNLFPDVLFDYIVFESGLEKLADPLEMLKRIKNRLTSRGILIIQTPDQRVIEAICEYYPAAARVKSWCAVPANEQAMNRLLIDSLLKKGEEQFSQGNIQAAIKAFEKVLRFDKHNSQALSNLGVIQWHLGDGESAIKTFHAALDINSNDADALANLLRAAMETGRFDLIRADLLERLELAQPANPDLKALMHACREAVPKP